MRIAICDDDKEIVAKIQSIVVNFFKEKRLPVPKIAVFYSGDSLLADRLKKDIVFLDIEMPGRDGICTGKKLFEQNKNIILVIITSFSEYLDDAMRINVFRYISKPIDSKRLKRNLSDALNAYIIKKNKEITVESDKGITRYNSSDILMIETSNRKVVIHTVNGTEISDKPLKEWLTILPDSVFYQCHRSYIVNISHIKRLLSDRIILDKEKTEAYLTKRKHHEIKKKWMLYIESSH